jgi:hypothetical protein
VTYFQFKTFVNQKLVPNYLKKNLHSVVLKEDIEWAIEKLKLAEEHIMNEQSKYESCFVKSDKLRSLASRVVLFNFLKIPVGCIIQSEEVDQHDGSPNISKNAMLSSPNHNRQNEAIESEEILELHIPMP